VEKLIPVLRQPNHIGSHTFRIPIGNHAEPARSPDWRRGALLSGAPRTASRCDHDEQARGRKLCIACTRREYLLPWRIVELNDLGVDASARQEDGHVPDLVDDLWWQVEHQTKVFGGGETADLDAGIDRPSGQLVGHAWQLPDGCC
jgi:hypothetical protein